MPEDSVKLGRLYKTSTSEKLQNIFTKDSAQLEFLSLCHLILHTPNSETLTWETDECLLFPTRGSSIVSVENRTFPLEHHDVLYIPKGSSFTIRPNGQEPCELYMAKALADHQHFVQHMSWNQISKDENRIRRLKGKDIYPMFSVSEAADRLTGGYTFFQPKQRSWPVHNHTDQDEIFIVTRGTGAMELYENEETKWFVTSVGPGDVITAPKLNYHPVFTREEPLEFIWCTAGARH